jgi:hypothetical protein
LEKQNISIYPLLLAVFGFMFIIASSVDFLLGKNSIPFTVSLIGLMLIIVAMFLRKREKDKWDNK